jgi:hypothetical protein
MTGMPVRVWPDLSQVMERHKDFYLQAERRNGPLVHNVLSQWGDGSPAVLVAGGYHAEGVRDFALSRGLGYISLIPRVSSIENLPPVLESFRSKGKRNEWVFRGNQSGLHRPLPTAKETPIGANNDFVQTFVGVVAAMIVNSVADTENSLGSSFVSHLNLALAQMADAARRVGLDLNFDVESVRNVETEGIRVDLKYSCLDRHSNEDGLRTVNGSTSVMVSGKRAGEVRVRIKTTTFLSSLLDGWGFSDVQAGFLRRIKSGGERVSVWGAQIVYQLGQKAKTSAIILVNPLKHLGSNWLADGVKEWTQNLRLGEDRRVVRLALSPQTPPGLQVELLERLAEAHQVPMMANWKGQFMVGFEEYIPEEEKPEDAIGNQKTLKVIGQVGNSPVRIDFGVSNARALIENPGSHSPYQMVRFPDGVFHVILQMPSVANEAILLKVKGGVLREITGLLSGESLSDAHANAFAPREKQELERHFWVDQLQSPGAAMDTSILSSINKDTYSMVKPTLQLKVHNVTGEELKNSKTVIDFTRGPESVRSQMDARFGLWDTFMGKAHDLSGDIRGLRIFSRYLESRGTLFGFFPSLANKTRLLEEASALVANRLTSAGAEQGRRASESSDSSDAAMVQSVSSQFLPLAQSLLGFLSVSGVSFNQENSADSARFVDQMFRVYAAHFKEGFRQGKGGAVASPAELVSLSGGVLHLTGSVSQSNAAGQMLKTLVNRSDQTEFKMMVLIDTEDGAEVIIEALVSRLEREFSDSPGFAAAIQALQSFNSLVVRNAGAFRVEGAISLEGVLNEFHTTWPALAGVGVFTSQAEAFRQDVESSLLSWALIDGNGNLVSRAVEDAVFKQAIQAFIRRQA